MFAVLQELGAGKVTYYHAGIENPDVKRANHEAWSQNKAQVICATVAFGMGINKPDVRFVIHNSMPKSITHYYQVTEIACPLVCQRARYVSGETTLRRNRVVLVAMAFQRSASCSTRTGTRRR